MIDRDDTEVLARYSESEFALLAETAADAGLAWDPPQVARVDDGPLSALKWGDGSPQIVLLHGGGQNAHTWDTVLLALRAARPTLCALAVDLPGHGRSAWRDDIDYSPLTSAATLEPFLTTHAPTATAVVGMSLGGLTSIALGQTAWSSTRRILVDVTPSAGRRVAEMTAQQRGATSLIGGPRSYPTFSDIVDAVAATSPHRSRTSLRRGVLHNARQADDGSWHWRYDTLGDTMDLDRLWSLVSANSTPTLLVRGGDSPYTTDDDVAEMLREDPALQVQTVAGAGHSIQGDKPIELSSVIERFVFEKPPG